MKETLKEGIMWLAMAIICGVIGGGLFIIVNNLIGYARVVGCFDYHNPEACEEERNEEI